jgi:hypothetical protein
MNRATRWVVARIVWSKLGVEQKYKETNMTE